MPSKKKKIPDSKLPLMSPSKKNSLKDLCKSCEDNQGDIWKTIGENLRKKREEHKYRASDIADILGCNTKTITNNETANGSIAYDTLLKYCAIYGCDIDYLKGKYKESNYEIHKICEKTGLDEKAVSTLVDNKSEYLKQFVNFMIHDSTDKESLSYRIIRFLARYRIPENEYFPEIAPFYAHVMEAAYQLHDPYEVPRLLDHIHVQENRIKEHFRNKGYSNEQIEDIKEQTEEFFEYYFYGMIAEEFELNNMKYLASSYIDKYLLKEGK